MSGATVEDFLEYWVKEGEAYARRGDYDWMASLVPGQRILEVGCGVGFGTVALARRGLRILALDTLEPCLSLTRQRVGEAGLNDVQFLSGDVGKLDDPTRATIADFTPDTVVCWLMGAPAEVTGAAGEEAGKAVAYYRERVHRDLAQLAADLPSVKAVHLVDRTAIPWQAKDIGRDTLVRYHLGKTFVDLPFAAERRNALYRKLEDNVIDLGDIRRSHPNLKSVVPTLASLLATRKF